MISRILLAIFVASLIPASGIRAAVGDAPGFVRPPVTPAITLQAAFVEKARYAIFEPGEDIDLWLQVEGWRQAADELLWEVRDYRNQSVDAGTLAVAQGEQRWESVLRLKPRGAGYFEVHVRLKNAEITLPRAGSRPAGFVSYGVLPDIRRLPLRWVDDSRFGAQGTNFLETGKFMQGNPFLPLYPALGLVWVHNNYRMGELEGKGPGTFKPLTDPEAWKKKTDHWAEAGLCPVIDLHGLPDWLIAWPDGKKGRYTLTGAGQAYPPNDWDAFGNYIRNVALEQAVRKKALFPNLKHNYYKIHWEPDWYWKGSDEEFIRMYEVAHKAIHSADPDGVLLGPTYGVIKTGNDHLRRLFSKGLGAWLDGISTHTYYIPFGFPESRGLPEQVRDLVELTRQYLKPGAKIINTEWGTNYHGRSVHTDRGVLRDEMAEFMRGHLITLGEGVDSTWYFYTTDIQSEGGLMYNLTSPNPRFGSIWVSPKPVAMAGAAATRLLEGTRSLGPVRFLDANVAAYLFDRAGERVLVLWSTDGKTREISVPAGVAALTRYDSMGNPTQVASVEGAVEITVDDVPVYLSGLSPVLYASNTLVGRQFFQGAPGEVVTLPAEVAGGRVVAWQHGEGRILETTGGKFKLPRTMAPGFWLIARTASDFEKSNGAEVIEVRAPLNITAVSGAGIGGKFALTNQLSVDVRGVLRLRAGDRLVPVETLMLKGGETRTVAVPADALAAWNQADAVVVEFYDDEGVVSPGPALQNHFTNAVRTQKAPAVDGLLRDWLLEEFTTFDTLAEMRAGAGDWKGPNDLMFRVGFRYDDDCLYIGVKVRDQSHVQKMDGGNIWQQDSLQIGLASRPENNGWGVVQKFTIALRSTDGAVVVHREPHNSGLQGGVLDPERYRAKVVRLNDDTYYFLAIPWREISAGPKGIPASRQIGVGLFVNDVDENGAELTKRKVMEGFGDGMGFFLPERFGVVNLSGGGRSP
jgi:hypothetical protein